MAGAWRPIPILGRAARNAAVLLRDSVVWPFLRRVPRDWVVARLDRGLVDAPRGQDLLDLLRSQPATLADLLQVLERASGDPRVHGVLLRVGDALGWAQLATLERSLARLRAAGKRSVVYAERTGNAGAWLGACADRFWMTPEGHLDLLGIRVESPYVRELLDRLRVRPEVLHAGRYKSAGELIERTGLSDEARLALESVVEDLYGALLRGLAEGRGVSPDVARDWIDRGPYLAADAREAGLVDALVYADELPERLAEFAAQTDADPGDASGGPVETSEADEAVLLPAAAYQRLSRPRFALEPLRDGPPRIGLILVEGVIRNSAQSARAVVGLLRRAAELSNVKAVVLRINSPGGDPLASDLIWRAVQRLRERKPVVASLGDVAASGGYYVAMAANEIIAEPTTLTGSIGVVLAGLSLDELAAAIGVRFDGVTRGNHAAIYDPFRRRSDEERALLDRQVQQIYRVFVEKAALGRGCEPDELAKVAEGRVWTGAQALEHGLVDGLGGPELALERARDLAGLPAGRGESLLLSPPSPIWQRLRGAEPAFAASNLARPSGPQLLCPIEILLR